jgi:DNA-binding transcriptional ArsR family regulator
MSRKMYRGLARQAGVFAALGDETRLRLVRRLADGPRLSISQLTAGSGLTRQSVTKHLGVLGKAGVVRHRRAGRERLFEFNPAPLGGIREYLDFISGKWDETLGRLKGFVEK